MAIYEILDDNNAVINTIIADLEFVEQQYPGKYRLVGVAVETPAENYNLSKRAFKARFPRAKWIAAKQAALASPALADFFEDFELSSYINVKDINTIAAVTAIGDTSMPVDFRLTVEEIDAVLNVPTQPGEEP